MLVWHTEDSLCWSDYKDEVSNAGILESFSLLHCILIYLLSLTLIDIW